MFKALLYLRLTSLKNLLVSRARRLRQPKYLAGAVVGAAYFWFFFFRHVAAAGRPAHAAGPALDHMQAAAREFMLLAPALAALVFLVILALMWLIPSGPAALGFSEAEIAFLFPAPITRRALVHFKLIGAQFRSLFGAVIMMLLSNRWTWLGGGAVTHALGWWFLFSAFNLHLTGSRFTLTRLSARRFGVARCRGFVVALFAAIVAATLANLPPAPLAPDPAGIARWLATLAHTAPLSWLLLPVGLLVAPFFATATSAFFVVVGPALLVLAAHYFWVVRSVVSFEEASIAKAEKRAALLAARRAGDRRLGSGPPKAGRKPPFTLAGTGRPELAFLWKNLLSTPSWLSLRTLLVTAGAILLGSAWLHHHGEWRGLMIGLGVAAAFACGYLLLIGPQFARQDIRHDLAQADILKTYPLAGWQVVLGELLTPTAILTGTMWLLLLTAALNLYPQHGEFHWLAPLGRPLAAGCAALLVPALLLLQLLVPNTATLLFPSWFQSSRHGERGIEVMGQRLLFFFAQFVVMIVTFAPALLLAGGAAYAVRWLIGPAAAMVIATLLALAVLLAEAAGGVWWLGRRFERFDLSSELRP
jgi:hypothetical protein